MKKPTEKQDELKRKRPPFTIVENKIIEDPKISKYALLVYLVLCKFADHNSNTCFPRFRTIAQYARCGVTSAKKAVVELVEAGYIRKTTRKLPGRDALESNLYEIAGGRSYGDLPHSDVVHQATKGRSRDDRGSVARRPVTISK